MAVYEYRRLYVTSDYRDRQVPCRCGNSACDRTVNVRAHKLEVADTGVAEKPVFTSEWSDKWADVGDEAVSYFNRLGQDGWRLTGFYPDPVRLYDGSGVTATDWPVGSHVFMREHPGTSIDVPRSGVQE
jgi:hypothetical protein